MGQDVNTIKKTIEEGKSVLGIEFGSTRIKAVLVGEDNTPIASGSHDWENQLVDGIWTYSLDAVWAGVQDCYKNMAEDVKAQYGVTLTKIGAMGFSGMMHGYIPFNKEGEQLAEFRTWRNTNTGAASEVLTDLFNWHMPLRWSVAHLYQSILNEEAHVKDIDYVTTLAGYVHWMLTGQKVMGVGEAAGMFPIDDKTRDYNQRMVDQFDELVAPKGFSWKLREIFPKVLVAGEDAGCLTEEGAKLLDVSGNLQAGIPICPPEGDAGTGMAATNSVKVRTGNVSAGTSVFSMVVLEKELSKPYPELDIVTTPDGHLVAMVHCNNCTSDLNAWVNVFKEFAESMGMDVDMNKLYGTLYTKALEGDKECGGLLSYNFLSGEHIVEMEEGRPMFVRRPNDKFNLANFMRVLLSTSLGALKTGNDILVKQENVQIDVMNGHGGLFKTPKVGQSLMAAALDTPVAVMKTAGEGGAWGIALLASYMLNKEAEESLDEFLANKVFGGDAGDIMEPDQADVDGFNEFIKRYAAGLPIERAAIDSLR